MSFTSNNSIGAATWQASHHGGRRNCNCSINTGCCFSPGSYRQRRLIKSGFRSNSGPGSFYGSGADDLLRGTRRGTEGERKGRRKGRGLTGGSREGFRQEGKTERGRRAFSLAVRSLVDSDWHSVESTDRVKFSSLAVTRTVFTHDDWKRHKSSGRHIRHVSTLLLSRTFRALGPPVALFTLVSLLVVSWNLLATCRLVAIPVLRMPLSTLSLFAPALSFLLVFRTNASYARFDEARKMWGLMLNRTRDTSRLCLSYMARGKYAHQYPKRNLFLRFLQAFALVYKHHLVNEGSLEEDLKQHTSLTEEEIQAIMSTTHRPNYVLQVLSECVRSCHMDSMQRYAIDQNLTSFADDVGGCERILKTPIPISYTRLTSRFLSIYHLLLPFALWDSCGLFTVVVVIVSSAVLFCVEEVGVLIEEPFSILPLDAIAATARNNVAELMKEHNHVVKSVPFDDMAWREAHVLPVDVENIEDSEYNLSPFPPFDPSPEPMAVPSMSEDDVLELMSDKVRILLRFPGPYDDLVPF